MSKMPEDATGAATTDDNEHDSAQHVVVSTIQLCPDDSVSGASDKENDAISPLKEKLSKETKKEAMGDICSDKEPAKHTTEVTLTVTFNDSNGTQKQPKVLKTDDKSIDPKKLPTTRPLDDARRRVSGVFYAGHGRRGLVDHGLRSTTFASRGIWRLHSTTCDGVSSRRSVATVPDDPTRQASNTARATKTADAAASRAAKQRTASADTPKKTSRS